MSCPTRSVTSEQQDQKYQPMPSQSDPGASQHRSAWPVSVPAPLLLAASADLCDGVMHSTVITGLGGGPNQRDAPAPLGRTVLPCRDALPGMLNTGQDASTLVFAQTDFFTLRQPLFLLLFLWLKDRIAD